MKASLAISVLLASVMSAGAYAQCSDGLIPGAVLAVSLPGKIVCAYKTSATDPSSRWSEIHGVDGTLTEWARGPGHPVDPSQVVGSWSLDLLAGTVTYTYGGTAGNPYRLYDNADGTYSLCGGDGNATVTKIVVPTGDNPCGWSN